VIRRTTVEGSERADELVQPVTGAAPPSHQRATLGKARAWLPRRLSASLRLRRRTATSQLPYSIVSFPYSSKEIPSFVVQGIFLVSLWSGSRIKPAKSDGRGKTCEIPSIFPVIWEFDPDETGSMGLHPPPRIQVFCRHVETRRKCARAAGFSNASFESLVLRKE
jgi:hypothetical protein